MSAAEGEKNAKTKTPSKKAKAKEDKALSYPYAVVRTGAKQYRVGLGDLILVEKLDAEIGNSFTIDEVLFVASGPGKFTVGQPLVAGAKVEFEVLQQTLAKKILIRHSRRRQNSQKTLGHRQPQTRLLVKNIGV